MIYQVWLIHLHSLMVDIGRLNTISRSDKWPTTRPHNAHYLRPLLILYGICALIPGSLPIYTLDYFIREFPDYRPEFVFIVILNIPLLIFMIGGVLFDFLLTTYSKIVVGWAGAMIGLIILPFLPVLLSQAHAWPLTLWLLMCLSFFNSIYQNGVFGYAGNLGSHAMSSLLLGTALFGLMFWSLRIIIVVIFPPETHLDYGCIIFFIVAIIFMAMTITWTYFIKSAELCHFDTQDCGIDNIDNYNSEVQLNQISDRNDNLDDEHQMSRSSITVQTLDNEVSVFCQMYLKLLSIAFQISFTFFVTFLILPGVALSTPLFFGRDKIETTWLVITVTSTLALFDTIGRLVADKIVIFNPDNIILLTVGRWMFIYTFIQFALWDDMSSVFANDYLKLINLIVFSFTHGYLSSCLMMFAPKMVNPQHKEKAGMVTNCHLIAGIIWGRSVI